MPGQNNSGEKAAIRVRPGHALGGEGVGLFLVEAFAHFPVRVFDHHDGAVDQHANGEDQAEQDHDIHGQAEAGEHQDAGQKGTGNGDADQRGGTQAERGDHHHHDQNDGADHVVLQIAQHGPDVAGFILAVADLNRVRPKLAFLRDRRLHRLDGFDDVFAGALGNLER